MTPVWIPRITLTEESMQSPKDVNSKCSQVTLHSGMALMKRFRISVPYCIGSWQTNAWRWHLERSSVIRAICIAMKSACRLLRRCSGPICSSLGMGHVGYVGCVVVGLLSLAGWSVLFRKT